MIICNKKYKYCGDTYSFKVVDGDELFNRSATFVKTAADAFSEAEDMLRHGTERVEICYYVDDEEKSIEIDGRYADFPDSDND